MPIPLAVDASDRPLWRGRMHGWAFCLAVPATTMLLLRAGHAAEWVAAGIYGGTLLAALACSTAYHRLTTTARAAAIMQRADHSVIYLLIAGTYAPVCLLALPRTWGIPLLVVVSAGAAVGVATTVFAFGRAPVLHLALYPALGWAAVAVFPALLDHLTGAELLLLLGGGVFFTAGIPVLVRKRPDPWPRRFGYHEVWHALTIAAVTCHFAAVAQMIGN